MKHGPWSMKLWSMANGASIMMHDARNADSPQSPPVLALCRKTTDPKLKHEEEKFTGQIDVGQSGFILY